MDNRPNILVLMCDQMQATRMGFVDGVAHTPTLDRLAGEGIHFTHAFTVHGQCVPSRASFMTGQSPHECGVMVNYGFFDHRGMLTTQHNTVAQVLRNAGYETVYFGKSHLGSSLENLGFENGHNYDNVNIPDDEATSLDIRHVPQSLRRDYKSASDAVAFLQNYTPGERPLFFVYSTNLPHPPFFKEPKFAHLFPPKDMQLPRSFYEETFDGKPPYQKAHAEDGRHGATDEVAAKHELADYYSMIAMMDEHFTGIVAEFERLGLWNNTLVLFTSDHGDMMGAHRTRLKGTLPYDELYHIPCIFKLPISMQPVRTTVDELVSSVGFAGTLLKLSGLEIPDSFTGEHFADAFFREKHPEEECVFFEHYAAYWGLHPFYGIRTREMKYIRYYGSDDTEELYDLIADPDELHNLIRDSRYTTVHKKLAGQADMWWASTDGRTVDYYESKPFRANQHNL